MSAQASCVAEMKAETERLPQARLETSIELQAMKKRIAWASGPAIRSSFDQGATRGTRVSSLIKLGRTTRWQGSRSLYRSIPDFATAGVAEI